MQLPYRKPGKYTYISSDHHITQERFDSLESDLERLKKKQHLVAAEVHRLAQMGDFSENAEYQLAKGRLRGINNAITKIQFELDHAIIIQPNTAADSVEIGSTVTVDINEKEKTYTILGSNETDPTKGIISHHSPLGSQLLGKQIGESGTLQLNGAPVSFHIKNIT